MSIQLKPGKWKTRDGRVAVVEFRTENPLSTWRWVGFDESGYLRTWTDAGHYRADAIDNPNDLIAPYTEPRLRPWKPEEVPVGALLRGSSIVRARVTQIVYVATEANLTAVGFCNLRGLAWISVDTLSTLHEHSTDGGKTWLPCGVMEDGE